MLKDLCFEVIQALQLNKEELKEFSKILSSISKKHDYSNFFNIF